MSLTGPLFLGGVLLVTLVAIGLLVVLWPRLAGPGIGPVAGRLGAILLVNLLVLFSAATQMNATYLFFSGWADLQGAVTGHVAQTALDRGGSATRALDAHVSGPAAQAAAQLPPLPGRIAPNGVVQFAVTGPLSHISGTVDVQLPPGYTSPRSRRTRYPVLEGFHGYPGVPVTWLRTFHVGRVLERLERAHRIRPTLVVLPQIEVPLGADTEGVNGARGEPQLETWLTRDVPNWVARTFRVSTSRDSWATIGDSSGGWAAAMSTLLHPSQYGAAIVMGGYFQPKFGSYYRPYDPHSLLAERYDLPRLVARRPPPVAVWLQTSHADPLSYGSTSQFLRAAHAPLSVHATVFKNAGHRISVWTDLLPQALEWLGGTVQGFRP